MEWRRTFSKTSDTMGGLYFEIPWTWLKTRSTLSDGDRVYDVFLKKAQSCSLYGTSLQNDIVR
jgi:hypothetical protein